MDSQKEVGIPDHIISLGEEIVCTDNEQDLLSLKKRIISETVGNMGNFDYLHRIYIRKKRALGMKCNAGRSMFL